MTLEHRVMTLLAACETALHRSVPDLVHERYEPGSCPHCSMMTNIQAQMRHRVKGLIDRLSDDQTPKP